MFREQISGLLLLIWGLSIPPMSAMFPAKKYMEAGVYLEIGTRLLVVSIYILMLIMVVILVSFGTGKPVSGSWPTYTVLLLIEAAIILFMLSMFNVKKEHT